MLDNTKTGCQPRLRAECVPWGLWAVLGGQVSPLPSSDSLVAGVALRCGDAAVQKLAELGFDARSGARPQRRVIRTMVEDPLAEMLLRGALSPGDAAELIVRDGTVAVDKTGA